MAVCSFDGAARLTGLDQGYWNIVSIHGLRERKANLPLAKSVHYSCFDDVEDEDSSIGRSPTAADIAAIFTFIGSLGSGLPPAPLMIHCQQGISRSAAVALSWVYGHLPPTDDRTARAIDLTLELRPQAKPNRLVLAFGLAQFMALGDARRLADQILSEPGRWQSKSRSF